VARTPAAFRKCAARSGYRARRRHRFVRQLGKVETHVPRRDQAGFAIDGAAMGEKPAMEGVALAGPKRRSTAAAAWPPGSSQPTIAGCRSAPAARRPLLTRERRGPEKQRGNKAVVVENLDRRRSGAKPRQARAFLSVQPFRQRPNSRPARGQALARRERRQGRRAGRVDPSDSAYRDRGGAATRLRQFSRTARASSK